MKPEFGRILVADDDSGIRRLLRMLLEHRGYDVLEAETGTGTVEVVAQYRPSVVVLDLTMPGIDGFTLIARLHEVYPDTRIIILSGSDAEPIRSQATMLGASEVFQKGFSLRAVTEVIEGYKEGYTASSLTDNRAVEPKV